MLRLLRLIDTCLSSSCLFIIVGWGHWLANFSRALNLEWTLWVKTLILISSSSPLPHLPCAAVVEVSLVPGSHWRRALWGRKEMALVDRSCALSLWQGTKRSCSHWEKVLSASSLKRSWTHVCKAQDETTKCQLSCLRGWCSQTLKDISDYLFTFPFDLAISLRRPPAHKAPVFLSPVSHTSREVQMHDGTGSERWWHLLPAKSPTKTTQPVPPTAWMSSVSYFYQQ